MGGGRGGAPPCLRVCSAPSAPHGGARAAPTPMSASEPPLPVARLVAGGAGFVLPVAGSGASYTPAQRAARIAAMRAGHARRKRAAKRA